MTNPSDAILAGVSRETLDDLVRFSEMFREFASHTNLVARSTLDDLWTRHILDSAQLHRLKPEAQRWLDLGSGGGFPGIVTAILLKRVPGAHVTLVESTGKKAGFLQTVVQSLSLPADVRNIRIEAVGRLPAAPEIVSGRALAPLPKLLEWAAPWLSHGSIGLFHKGRNFRAEVEESHAQWRFSMLEHPSMTDSQSAVLEISDLRRR